MDCYSPIEGWRGSRNPSGKRAIVFERPRDLRPEVVFLPCGQCIGCRLERSRQWAMRCLHESAMYKRNCFLTLTFDEVQMPEDGCISVRDVQLFMKRLRKNFPSVKIRFFGCGEYGDNFGRPHYHLIVFNLDFEDKYHWKTKNGFRLYRSPTLEKIWSFGHALIGDVTFESAAYVARYVVKKITGDGADEHYVDRDSGFIRTPEFVTMSRGGRGKGLGGIGKGWFEKYKSEVYPSDTVVVRGVEMKPPRFYDGLLEKENPLAFAAVKRLREAKARKLQVWSPMGSFRVGEASDERLKVKEFVKKSRVRLLMRSLEVTPHEA